MLSSLLSASRAVFSPPLVITRLIPTSETCLLLPSALSSRFWTLFHAAPALCSYFPAGSLVLSSSHLFLRDPQPVAGSLYHLYSLLKTKLSCGFLPQALWGSFRFFSSCPESMLCCFYSIALQSPCWGTGTVTWASWCTQSPAYNRESPV